FRAPVVRQLEAHGGEPDLGLDAAGRALRRLRVVRVERFGVSPLLGLLVGLAHEERDFVGVLVAGIAPLVAVPAGAALIVLPDRRAEQAGVVRGVLGMLVLRPFVGEHFVVVGGLREEPDLLIRRRRDPDALRGLVATLVVLDEQVRRRPQRVEVAAAARL